MKNYITVKNVLICLVVIFFIGSYFYFEVQDAKKIPTAEEHEQYMLEQREKEAEELREDYISEAIPVDEIIEYPADYEGVEILVSGSVACISHETESNGSPTFIDMLNAYPNENRLTIVIWEENLLFVQDALDTLNVGDNIYVYGALEIYDGVPTIEVTDSSQFL